MISVFFLLLIVGGALFFISKKEAEKKSKNKIESYFFSKEQLKADDLRIDEIYARSWDDSPAYYRVYLIYGNESILLGKFQDNPRNWILKEFYSQKEKLGVIDNVSEEIQSPLLKRIESKTIPELIQSYSELPEKEQDKRFEEFEAAFEALKNKRNELKENSFEKTVTFEQKLAVARGFGKDSL